MKSESECRSSVLFPAKLRLVVIHCGFKIPSIRKRIAARTSIKRAFRQRLGLKAPRGWGWITNPRKAAYNRVYNRTTRGCLIIVAFIGLALVASALGLFAVCAEG